MLILAASIVLFVLGVTAISRRTSLRTERGEGVISVAIAVLIMAVVGVIVFGALQGTARTTTGKVDNKINEIN
jgi:multisubunit Na+/H+ antiporter MnhB subunit